MESFGRDEVDALLQRIRDWIEHPDNRTKDYVLEVHDYGPHDNIRVYRKIAD